MKPATPILMRELVMCVLVGSHLVVLSNGEGRERPRFAVWGARMNLRKAGGTAVCQPRFRLPRNRGVHNARPRGSLGCNVGSDEPPNHHEQSRERERDLSVAGRVGQRPGEGG